MKPIVFILVLLACAKIGYHEVMFRSSTNEVIVTAYRERAVSACQRDPKGLALVQPTAWANSDNVRLRIGKGGLGVYIWQVDHALWNARFKNPYLFLSAGDKPGIYCEFDIVHGQASVFRM